MTGRPKLAAGMGPRQRDAMKRAASRLGLVAALLLWAPAAPALDPPHDATTPSGFCMDCHTPHNALGPALQAQGVACLGCHNTLPKPPTGVSGFGVTSGWNAADQAGQVAGAGSSHNWSKSAVNAAAEAQLPSDPEMLKRINNVPAPYQGNLSCAVCHNPHSQANDPFDPLAPATLGAADRHFMRIGNAAANNGLCVQCHVANDVTAAGTYTGGAQSHPVRVPLPGADTTFHTIPQRVGGGAQVAFVDGAASAVTTTTLADATKVWAAGSLVGQWIYLARVGLVRQITANTATQVTWAAAVSGLKVGDLYQIDPDGNPSNKHALLNGSAADGTTGSVVCLTCHGVHYADSDSTTLDNRPGGGDGRLLRRSLTAGGLRGSAVAGKDDACVGCHNLLSHTSTVTGTGRYTFAFGCTDCHDLHGTTSIMLVKQTLTYATGLSTTGVDLRALNTAAGSAPDLTFGPAKDTGGVGPNDLANSLAPGKGPCEACHTQTQDLAAAGAQPRFRNTGGGASGRHFQNQCLACHPHNQGFKGQESAGGSACYPCHSYGMRSADATALKQGTYHHVIENDAVAGFVPSATPTAAVDGDKRCTQCHVDHPFGANRATNLRTSISTATAVATDIATATPYGICLSCHTGSQTKNTTDQKRDGTTATYAISQADYAASAHDYATEPTGTIFKATSGNFTVSCVKCHSDGQPTATQSGTFKFALHSSNDRRLRNPLGITTFTAGGDALEESFCYRCHSASTDTTPGGGPAKGTTANDYFGVVTNMSAGATGIFAQMQKGTAGTPASTVSGSTLYFRSSATANQPMPAGYILTSGTYTGNTAYRAYDMTPGSIGSAQTSFANTTTSGTNPRYMRMMQFISPPVSISSNNTAFGLGSGFTIVLQHQESNVSFDAYLRYALYKWLANDSQGTNFVAVANSAVELGNNTTSPYTQTLVITSGSSVAFNTGDRIVVELEVYRPSTTNATATFYWNGSEGASLVLPASLTFDVPGIQTSGRHDVGSYSGIHWPNPADETQAYISANKHVECEDCHNPHAAGKTKHTAPGNAVAATSPIYGVTGIEPTYGTANWTAATSYTAQVKSAKEYQICFKCHSAANTGLATWDATWTDVALEFSTKNLSGHPVVDTLNNYTNSAAPKALTNTFMVAPWTSVGTQTMYCSDCHGNDAASPAAQGPHGSAADFILKGTNARWPAQANGTTLWTISNTETSIGTASGLFCRNCHNRMSTTNSVHSRGDHTSAACINCHILVPHGGKMSRLIGDRNGAMPARYAYQGNLNNMWITSFTKNTPNNYTEGNCGSTQSGCTRHSLTNGENW